MKKVVVAKDYKSFLSFIKRNNILRKDAMFAGDPHEMHGYTIPKGSLLWDEDWFLMDNCLEQIVMLQNSCNPKDWDIKY